MGRIPSGSGLRHPRKRSCRDARSQGGWASASSSGMRSCSRVSFRLGDWRVELREGETTEVIRRRSRRTPGSARENLLPAQLDDHLRRLARAHVDEPGQDRAFGRGQELVGDRVKWTERTRAEKG